MFQCLKGYAAFTGSMLSGLLMLTACSAHATNTQPFNQWVAEVKQEAQSKGMNGALLDKAFQNIEVNDRILELDRKQPESTITFDQYLDRVVSDARIKQGRAMYQEHKELLEEIGREFGVQPRYIVALWGIETSYGKITGGFSVVEALSTLAYDGRRSDFFRSELMRALQILNEGHIDVADMKGSWAGAMGQSQFMPSSFVSYAYDYNKDGRRDIWTTQADVFASMANYLAKSGWNDDITWGREVQLPKNFDMKMEGRTVKKTIPEWQALGVRKLGGGDLPGRAIPASIVVPDKSNRALMTYGNYDVIMKWNRSTYFATAVGKLSDKIAE